MSNGQNPNPIPIQNMSIPEDQFKQLLQDAVQSGLMSYHQAYGMPAQTPQVPAPPAPPVQQPIYAQPAPPVYINQPPVYPQQPTITANDIAQAMSQYMNSAACMNNAQTQLQAYQTQAQLGPMAGLTMMDIMSMPEPIRSSYLGYMAQPQQQNPQLAQMQQQINDIAQMQQMQMWENNRHHSTKHKVLKYGAIAVGIGGVAYGIHKLKHRHDDDKKYELLSHSIDSYVSAKYGKDV